MSNQLAASTWPLVSILALVIGCEAAPPIAPPLASSPLAPSLELLWSRHGGREALMRPRGVVFRYEAELRTKDPGKLTLRTVLLDFDQPSVVYVDEAPGGETEPRWRRIDLSRPPRAGEGERDLCLRSASFLFQLPLALTGSGWDLRSKRSGSLFDEGGAVEFEASVHGVPYALGPFLVPAEELAHLARNSSFRLDHVFYLSRHPAERRGPYEVRFGEFVVVDGIPVATLREHALLQPGEPRPPRHPLEIPTRPPTTWVRTERISGIRFVDDSELREVLRPSRGPEADTGKGLAAR